MWRKAAPRKAEADEDPSAEIKQSVTPPVSDFTLKRHKTLVQIMNLFCFFFSKVLPVRELNSLTVHSNQSMGSICISYIEVCNL